MKKAFIIGLITIGVALTLNVSADAKEIVKDSKIKNEHISVSKNKDSKFDNCKILINRVYKGFYGREADKDGLEYWAGQISNNKQTVANVLETFINSNEFKNKKYNNKEYVKALYKGIFGREVDNSGLVYWTNILNDGGSRRYVLSRNIESSEFNKLLSNFGINNKGTVNLTLKDKKNEVKDLIRDLYKGFHNRTADKDGTNYWTDQIINNKRSVAEVIQCFMDSDEIKNKNYSNEQFVKASYLGILGRQPDKAGLEFWTSILNDGNSRRFVVAQNFNSSEFQNRLDNLGIKNKGRFIIELKDRKGEVKQNVIYNFYEGFQGRKADENGANYWTEQIVNGNKTVAEVAEGFIYSKEFVDKNYSGSEYIKAVYKGILGRDTDESGLNFWLNQLINGKSKRFVASSIFDSKEFQDKLDSLGIKNKGKIKLSNQDIQENIAKAKINYATMNLRSQPSLKSNVLTTMAPGSDIVILGRAKGDLTYYKVKYVKNGKIYEGYVSMYLDGVSVVEVYSDNGNNDFLGVLSEKYESNGDPGLISSGVGDYGGKSYGAWQFSSKMGSLNGFVNWLKGKNYSFHKKLVDARKLDSGSNCGPNFDKAWKDIAKNNYNSFYNLQHTYVKEQFYDELVRELMKVGDFSNILSSFAGRNVLWSTVVQHGVSGAKNIIAPLKNVKNVDSFISAVYKERGRKNNKGQLVHFISSSQAVQNGVASRFKREEAQALQMYKYEKNK